MKLLQQIERHWYVKTDQILTIILFPFSLIYEFIVYFRRLLFKLHILPQQKLATPVVIIGNISVGGAGKTPLTLYLAQKLQQQNINIGIILRGYKSQIKTPHLVLASDDSLFVGDEALIYAQHGFNVVIASSRVAAGKLLLELKPQTQLILADDGMQHYYLARDFEICVIDSSRMLGNQQLLPLGPLREPLARLKKVNAIVINANYNRQQLQQILNPYAKPIYYQQLEFVHFFNPQTQTIYSVTQMQNQKILAMAAIGNPERFFAYLSELGLNLTKWKIFPDHYHYLATDINPEYTIITTEKDYTKLAKYKPLNVWICVVQAKLHNEELIKQISKLINPINPIYAKI